jgi:hypothetical protein
VIPVGGFSNEAGGVTFKATATDYQGQQWKLEVRDRGPRRGVTNVATLTSALTNSGGTATLASGPLADGSYKWQYRLVDSAGNAGAWTAFGGNPANAADFTIDTVVPTVTSVTSTALDGAYTVGASINVDRELLRSRHAGGRESPGDARHGDGRLDRSVRPGDQRVRDLRRGGRPELPGPERREPARPLRRHAPRRREQRLHAHDPAGQNIADFKAIVIDTTAPTITSVTSSTANGTYGAGTSINVTVNFSEFVTLVGGNLQVTLDTGAVVSIAPFGPATSATGTYLVAAGQTSADLNASSPLTLSAGSLRDAAANNCVLTIPAGQNLSDSRTSWSIRPRRRSRA